MANGDITYTNPGGQDNVKAFAGGSYIGKASTAINIVCGFKPSKIVLHNRTSIEMCVWTSSMVDTYVYLTVANGTRTLVQLGSGGVEGPNPMTAAQAAAAGGEGFTVAAGTTTAFNTDAEIVDWEAYR